MLLSSFYLRIFPSSPQPSMRSQISLCSFQESSVSKRLHKQKGGTLRDEITYHRKFLRNLPRFAWKYFLFHHCPQCAPKYHFADSTRTVLANGFMNIQVELCEMNSQNRNKFLTKLLSRFYLRIFSFSVSSSK